MSKEEKPVKPVNPYDLSTRRGHIRLSETRAREYLLKKMRVW